MGDTDGGQSVSVWLDADLLARVDSEAAASDESRSKIISDRLALGLAVEGAFDAIPFDFDTAQEKAFYARQSIMNEAAHEMSEDEPRSR